MSSDFCSTWARTSGIRDGPLCREVITNQSPRKIISSPVVTISGCASVARSW